MNNAIVIPKEDQENGAEVVFVKIPSENFQNGWKKIKSMDPTHVRHSKWDKHEEKKTHLNAELQIVKDKF